MTRREKSACSPELTRATSAHATAGSNSIMSERARPIMLPALDRTLTIVTQRPPMRSPASVIAAGYLRERLVSLHRAGILRGELLTGTR